MAKQINGAGMADYVLSILRLVAGFLILCHGVQKLFGMLGGHRMPITSLLGLAGIIETVGGILLILGLFTRPAAFILCGEMAVAYFRAHAPRAPLPIQNMGEPAVLNCFIFLYLIFAGAGAISLDRLARGRR